MIKFLFASKKIYMIVRIGLGLVFISSGAMKLFDLDAFSKVIEAFAILSPQFCYPFAVMISLLEISIGF
ncbi:MAG: DoxX family membrane protein, partial [Proteobacteria bacterium]|nr:DoxX family membrane protein [Pseudomonadota bacterium]